MKTIKIIRLLKLLIAFKDLHSNPKREAIYSKIKEKIESDYGYSEKPNPNGAALPYLKTCDYYIDIEYEDKFETVKNLYYNYYFIHGMGFRKKRITEDEYKIFVEKLNKVSWKSDFNTIWTYLTNKYSYEISSSSP